MGFDDECFSQSVDEMIDEALSTGDAWLKGISRERLEREGHVRLAFGDPQPGTSESTAVESPGAKYFLPFAEGHFATASGKAELYNASLIELGLDPVASFTPPTESRHVAPGNGKKAAYPLELLARKADRFS